MTSSGRRAAARPWSWAPTEKTRSPSSPATVSTPHPGADGVQDFTVSVNDRADMLLHQCARTCSSMPWPATTISWCANRPDQCRAGNTPAWNVQIFIAGGTPAAPTGDQGDVLEVETPGTQTVSFTPRPAAIPAPVGVVIPVPTGIDTAILNDTTNTSAIAATPFTITALSYTSSPGGVEQVEYQGLDGNDSLTVITPAGANSITYTPGAAVDSASVQVGSLVPFNFLNLGAGGSVTLADVGGARVDSLVYNGTAANDKFSVAATTGAVTLNSQLAVSTPGVANVTLDGLAGDDTFALHGTLPYTATTVSGGDPSASDIVNLTGATGLVTVNLANSITPTDTTITGYGGTVTLTGVEVANLDANTVAGVPNPLTVVGTAGNDNISYTPSGAAAGTFQNAGLNTVFNFTNVTGLANPFTINGNGGTDQVTVNGTAASDTITAAVSTTAATNTVVTVNALKEVNIVTAAAASLVVEGDTGNDNLTVDNVRGPVTIPITYDGGPGTNALTLVNGTATSDTYTPGSQLGSGTNTLVFAGGARSWSTS